MKTVFLSPDWHQTHMDPYSHTTVNERKDSDANSRPLSLAARYGMWRGIMAHTHRMRELRAVPM